MSDLATDREAEEQIRWARRELARRGRPLRRTKNTRVPSNRAPVDFVHCPVHYAKVGRDGEGRLLGRCDGCMNDYAIALRRLAKMRSAA